MRKRIPLREYHSSVSAKGQITLPVAWRQKLGIKPGDQVSIKLGEDGMIVSRAPSFLDFYMSVPALDPPRTPKEMTEIAAEEVAQEFARKGV
jgi:AbrB family looped-hinge helix DNA binding protein